MQSKASKKGTSRTASRTAGKTAGKAGRTAKTPASVLAIDVGGTTVKLLASGETQVREIPSGPKMTPAQMVRAVRARAKDWKFEAISLGYPGLVGDAGPVTEPANLGPGWVGFDFQAAFGYPLRIVNDATMQALGSYDGGRMLFLGFGTGVGSVLIIDQCVVPLELGELATKGGTLYERFGRRGLEKAGKRRWRERVLEIIPSLQRAFLVDYIVLGGGNSKHVIEPLPPNVRIGHNLTAFRGGYRLWHIDPTIEEFGQLKDHSRAIGEWRLL